MDKRPNCVGLGKKVLWHPGLASGLPPEIKGIGAGGGDFAGLAVRAPADAVSYVCQKCGFSALAEILTITNSEGTCVVRQIRCKREPGRLARKKARFGDMSGICPVVRVRLDV